MSRCPSEAEIEDPPEIVQPLERVRCNDRPGHDGRHSYTHDIYDDHLEWEWDDGMTVAERTR